MREQQHEAVKQAFLPFGTYWLCRQIKDPKQNGGRPLEQLLDHVANDDLVGWGWSPGDGRTLPPLSRLQTAEQIKIWIVGGAACPQ